MSQPIPSFRAPRPALWSEAGLRVRGALPRDTDISKASLDSHFAFLHFFFMAMASVLEASNVRVLPSASVFEELEQSPLLT